MKLSILFIFLMSLQVTAFGQAQMGDLEFSGSAGLLSAIQIVNNFSSGFAGDKAPTQQTSSTPNYFVSAKYYVGSRIALGITVGAQSISGATTPDQVIRGYTYYTYRQDYYTAAAELTFIYRKRKSFQLYSTYGIGGSYVRYHYSYPQGGNNLYNPANGFSVNGYLSPIGFRVGNDFAGFIEFGIGYKGLVNAGISYKFKTRKTRY